MQQHCELDFVERESDSTICMYTRDYNKDEQQEEDEYKGSCNFFDLQLANNKFFFFLNEFMRL